MVTFSRDEIIDALHELLIEIADVDTDLSIRVVGGAALAINFGRTDTTRDIDALYGSHDRVNQAAQTIAARRGWPENWLNNDVKMFATHFDSDDDWTTLETRDNVAIRIANAPLLLAMKLRAARGRRDAADIDLLLATCELTQVQEAEDIFNRYYPEHELSERALRQGSAAPEGVRFVRQRLLSEGS